MVMVDGQAEKLLGELDLSLMADMAEADGSTEEHPKWKTVYYIGWPQELAAGIWGGAVSDTFDTPEDALAWFAENYERLEREMGDDGLVRSQP